MHSWDGLHQVRRGVVSEVGADIADAQTSTTGFQILGMLVSRFVQCVNLWKQQRQDVRNAGENEFHESFPGNKQTTSQKPSANKFP